jgi:general secretion pathway protein A
MYTKFFGLKEKPFEITPDPRFLYLSENHREALANLAYAVNEGKGFTVITGEVGTGKTTLVQMLLSRLDGQTRTANLFNPRLSAKDFLRYICDDLGLETDGKESKGQLLTLLHEFLLGCYSRKEKVILIVDEAQTLTPTLLEEVRLLTNLETARSKLVQVILLGQPELDKTLDDPSLRQLKQRVSIRYNIHPLSRDETREYIKNRLKIAGARNASLFDESAVRLIYNYSKGLPRLINIVCDNALLVGYAEGERIIGKSVIREVIRDSESPAKWKKRHTFIIVFGVIVIILALGFFFYLHAQDHFIDQCLYPAERIFRWKILKG